MADDERPEAEGRTAGDGEGDSATEPESAGADAPAVDAGPAGLAAAGAFGAAPGPAPSVPAAAEAAAAPEPEAEPEPEPPLEPVEELSAADEASSARELAAAVRTRRAALDGMPDGPRPLVPGQTYKRRQMVVEWQLQLSYVGTYLMVAALVLIGFAAMNYTFAAFFRRALAIQQHRPGGESPDFFFLASLNVILLIVLVIGMAIYAIVQSHRIAGPVFRFRRAIQAMLARDYDFFLQLRKADYLKDVADQMNELNNALKAKDVVISDALLALEDVRERNPDLADDLDGVVGALADVVLPPDEE